MSSKRILGVLVAAVAVTMMIGAPALAKSKKKKVKTETYVAYAIPFSCGPNDDGFGGVVPAEYETAITLTNLGGEEAMLRARYQLTDPESQPSDRIRRNLRAGRSILVDCDTLLDGAFIQPVSFDVDSFYQGVLTVRSRSMLNVVAQTTETGPEGDIEVQSRQIPHQIVKLPRDDDDDNVEICHIPPGNPSNRHTIEVDDSSVGAHLSHGDHRGECDD
jgi:hypothetical protein